MTNQSAKAKHKYLPQELHTTYREGNLCLFVGAGVSQGCGLPNWSTLADEVIAKVPERRMSLGEMAAAGRNKRSPRYINPDGLSPEAKQHLKAVGPLFSMRHLRGMASINLEHLVQEVLYDRHINIENSTASAIAQLHHVRRICSFNYDDILLRALDAEQANYRLVFDGEEIVLDSPETLIYFPHGFLPEPKHTRYPRTKKIVFSEDDYHDLYASTDAWPNRILVTLLQTYTALFVGCSLQDPNLRRLLHQIAKAPSSHVHHAFLLDPAYLPEGKWYQQGDFAFRDVQTNILKGLNVKPVWVGKYEEIPHTLLELDLQD